MRADFAEGTLDDPDVHDELASVARFADVVAIRDNLEAHYPQRGGAEVPAFEAQLEKLRAHTTGVAAEFRYPDHGQNGCTNALSPGLDQISGDPLHLCFAVEVPAGAELRLVYRDTSEPPRLPEFFAAPEGQWMGSQLAPPYEWTTVGAGYRELGFDVEMAGQGAGTIEIDLYEDRLSETPTRTQRIAYVIE